MSNKLMMVSLGLGFVTLTMAVWGQRTQPSFSPNPPSPSHFLGHPRLFHPRKLSQIIRDSLPTPLSSPTQAECNRVISQAVYNLSQPWTADNRPFRQARLQIERLYAKMDVPTFMQKVVLPYHRTALKHPADALTVFRYGYALRLGAFAMVNGFDQFVTLKLLATPEPPYAWDYARMMYLWLGLLPDDGNMGGTSLKTTQR